MIRLAPLAPLVKYAIAMPVFMAGWYFFFVSIHLLLNSEASFTRVLVGGMLGLTGVLISGYIMAPMVAEQIAANVTEHLKPFLALVPGGRRRSDPPALAPPPSPPPRDPEG